MSKANRVKGRVRTKYRFVCEGHFLPSNGPIRFKHSDARRDWDHHNVFLHGGRKTTMTKDEAIALLLAQKIVVS